MISKKIIIKNQYGIHARPSSEISELASQFYSTITISYNENQADATSIMSLILLCVEPNSEVLLSVEGDDEAEAFSQLVNYLEITLPLEEEH